MLANIAPAAPEATLAALERDITPDRDLTAISHSATHIHLLRSLAYDADRFPRAARLLARVASSASATGQSNYAANALASLLQICYSGTRAPVEDRLALLGPLLESELPEGRELGLKALSSALEGWQFQPFQDFDFGAHSRDYGYWPKSEQEVRHWFATVLTFSARHARPSSPLSAKVRRIIADQLQGMWTGARVYDEIERTSHALSQAQYWPEGWQAAREVLYHHGSALPPTDLARLTALEQMLRPRDDAQKVRAVVLSRDHVGLYVADVADRDNLEETRAAVFATAEDLGARLAQDRPALADLLPDLTAGGAHVWEFGRGLFRGTTDAGDTWNKLIHAFLAAPEHQRNLQFLCGFTQAMSETNRPLANLLLDGLLENAAASLLPPLQSVAGVDEEGSARLTQCLSRNLAPIESYRSLAQAAATDDTPADKLKDIILTIAEKPGGFRVSCEILRGRLWADQKAKRGHHPRMLEVGRELVRQAPITEIRDQRDGLHLHEITRACLLGQEGANVAEEVCRKIVEAVAKHQAHPIYLGGLIGGLFAVQPSVALSGLFGQTHLEIDRGVTMFRNMHQNPVDGVPESNLLAWCDGDPRTRYPAVAKLITPLANEKWTDLALSILRHAPDRAKVLKQYVGRFELDRWRGSRADAIESRAKLLDILPDLNDSGLEKSVAESKDRLLKLAEEARREEAEAERRRNETFE
jgi:hypothetical protein